MMQQDVRPKFQVEKLEGKVTQTVHTYKTKKVGDKRVNELVTKEVERDAGFMVYTAKGDVFRVRDLKELRRLGFDKPAAMIDMESGEEVGMMQLNLKEMAARRTKLTPPERMADNFGDNE